MSKSLKVLMVSHDFKPNLGGLAEYVHQVALHLKRFGDEPIVLASPAPGSLISEYEVARKLDDRIQKHNGSRWNVMGRYATHSKNVARRFEVLKGIMPDLVWLTSPLYKRVAYSNYFWSCACRRAKVPYVVTSHGSESKRLAAEKAQRAEKALVRGASKVLAVSEYVKENLVLGGLAAQNAIVVNNGVSLECLRGSDGTFDLPASFADSPMVLCMCRFVEWKRVHILLLAFSQVLAEVPTAKLVLCGEGEERERLERLIGDLGIQDKVFLPGYVTGNGKWALFEHADVYAMPSSGEGFGISFVEAAAKGTPCVTTEGDGATEAVLHEQTGLVVPPDDPQALSKAIVRLLKDKQFARRLGEAGRQRVERELNWSVIAERVHGILEEVVR